MSVLSVEQAVHVLLSGGVIGLPTETVYGLAADADDELAVRQVFALKGRPADHPLIVHVADLTMAQTYAQALPVAALTLAERFWPGPLTLVVKRSFRASDAVTGGQETVALRVPAHPLALQILRGVNRGLAAPSANRFGAVSPTTRAHVLDSFGSDFPVLDGGACAIGVESTIVDLSSPRPRLLRPGAVTLSELEAALGVSLQGVEAPGGTRAPGLLPSHYSPRAGVRLVAKSELAREAEDSVKQALRTVFLCPDNVILPAGVASLPLPSNVEGYARVLYALLREADAMGAMLIVAPWPEGGGIADAVRDRLSKASAPKNEKPLNG